MTLVHQTPPDQTMQRSNYKNSSSGVGAIDGWARTRSTSQQPGTSMATLVPQIHSMHAPRYVGSRTSSTSLHPTGMFALCILSISTFLPPIINCP